MQKRKNIKTTIEEIVDYWSEYENESELSVDFDEANKRCWRCGHKRKLERCHIVPASRGGEDTPSNLVLLCKDCHKENPNVTDSEIMWDWLRAYAVPFYNTFWYEMGLAEYERIYGIKIIDEINRRNMSLEDIEEIKGMMKDISSKTTYHFGSGHLNPATVAGAYRMLLKEYDKKHGLITEKKITSIISRQLKSKHDE